MPRTVDAPRSPLTPPIAGDSSPEPGSPARRPRRRPWRRWRRWRRKERWLAAALLPLLSVSPAVFSCAQAQSDLERLTAGSLTERVRVFLIAPGDDGRSGRKVGCGDSVLPVEVTLPRRQPALEGALRALLAMSERTDPASGLYNPLYASRLTVASVARAGAQARVDLKGYLELGGECDDPRILAQLQETALQFPDVQQVSFYVEGKPLAQLLSGKG